MVRSRPQHRYVATTLGVAAVLAGLVIVLAAFSAPVNAEGAGCETLSGYSVAAGSQIGASRYRFCDGTEILLPVRIERFQSPGVWQTVASGTGDVVYNCSGSAFNRYKIPYVTGPFEILCG